MQVSRLELDIVDDLPSSSAGAVAINEAEKSTMSKAASEPPASVTTPISMERKISATGRFEVLFAPA